MAEKNNQISVGLFKSRHDMPVNEYIFENGFEDVMDFTGMRKIITEWFSKNVTVDLHYGVPLNYGGYGDVETYKGNRKVFLYVTGLTSATAEVIRFCAFNGISLSLMHFDRDSGEYEEQPIF